MSVEPPEVFTKERRAALDAEWRADIRRRSQARALLEPTEAELELFRQELRASMTDLGGLVRVGGPAPPPTVSLPAKRTKRRRRAVLPFTPRAPRQE